MRRKAYVPAIHIRAVRLRQIISPVSSYHRGIYALPEAELHRPCARAVYHADAEGPGYHASKERDHEHRRPKLCKARLPRIRRDRRGDASRT